MARTMITFEVHGGSKVLCGDCDWEGKAADCEHGCKSYDIRRPGSGQAIDTAPMNLCPKCGSEDLIPLDIP